MKGRELVTKALGETEAQIDRLLEVKRLLEHDWSDKLEAFQLDYHAAKLVDKPYLAQYKVKIFAHDIIFGCFLNISTLRFFHFLYLGICR